MNVVLFVALRPEPGQSGTQDGQGGAAASMLH
jgi:hypothetical protein